MARAETTIGIGLQACSRSAPEVLEDEVLFVSIGLAVDTHLIYAYEFRDNNLILFSGVTLSTAANRKCR